MRAIFYVYRDYDTVPYKSSVTPYCGSSLMSTPTMIMKRLP